MYRKNVIEEKSKNTSKPPGTLLQKMVHGGFWVNGDSLTYHVSFGDFFIIWFRTSFDSKKKKIPMIILMQPGQF